jgi:hypothetical protein
MMVTPGPPAMAVPSVMAATHMVVAVHVVMVAVHVVAVHFLIVPIHRVIGLGERGCRGDESGCGDGGQQNDLHYFLLTICP